MGARQHPPVDDAGLMHPELCHSPGMLPHGRGESSPSGTALPCFHRGQRRQAPLTGQLTVRLEASFPRLGDWGVGGGGILCLWLTHKLLGLTDSNNSVVPSLRCTLLKHQAKFHEELS